MKVKSWRFGCSQLLVAALLCLVVMAADGSSAKDSERVELPVTKKEFLKIVHRGMLRSDLIKRIGMPSTEKPGQEAAYVELIFRGAVLATEAERREDVTIVIFKDYDNVYAIIWSDGQVAEIIL